VSLAKRTSVGAKWSLASVGGRRIIVAATTILLAHMLPPADFGLVAMAMVFSGISDLVRDLGTGPGIVQAESPTEELLSSVFWLNAASGIVAAAVMFAFAPLAGRLLQNDEVVPILRALSVLGPVSALSVVHTSLLSRGMRFRRLAIVELTGTIAAAVLGVAMALAGRGVWSLVAQLIGTAILVSIGTWLAMPWRPRLVFRLASIRSILNFSANLTGFNIANYIARNADNLLVGRYLGAENLGYYDLAYRLMLYPLQMVSWALGRVVFPAYVQMRKDPARLAAAYLRVSRAIAAVVFPVMFGLVAMAVPLANVVLGPDWAVVGLLLVILGPVGALQSIGTTVGYIYQAMGRTDLMFRWSLGSGAVVVAAFVVGLRWGVVGVASAYAIAFGVLAYPLFSIPLSLIQLRVSRLARELFPPFACSAVTLAALSLTGAVLRHSLDASALLTVQIVCGVAVYAAMTWKFNHAGATDVIEVLTAR
jgi:PST family polysaccharide transporter